MREPMLREAIAIFRAPREEDDGLDGRSATAGKVGDPAPTQGRHLDRERREAAIGQGGAQHPVSPPPGERRDRATTVALPLSRGGKKGHELAVVAGRPQVDRIAGPEAGQGLVGRRLLAGMMAGGCGKRPHHDEGHPAQNRQAQQVFLHIAPP